MIMMMNVVTVTIMHVNKLFVEALLGFTMELFNDTVTRQKNCLIVASSKYYIHPNHAYNAEMVSR